MKEYIKLFPKPLLRDLTEGLWLPIVGAGLSRNADVPAGKAIPLWEELGRALSEEIPDYPYSGAIDAISSYAHEFSRTRLIERLSELLLIAESRPSEVHRAFCSIPFSLVCTTNFDFLLERQYALGTRYCRVVLDEDQLSLSSKTTELLLLKLHGDLNHPQRLVVTEEDYDKFIAGYPLLATFLANLLITRTAVLIGYSLDDPDFRQIWQVIGERLGRQRRHAYALVVNAKPSEIARFDRRGVKVINLPGSKSKYAKTLAETFDDLREYLSASVIPASLTIEEDPLRELSLPPTAINRLCFFAIPYSLHPFYKQNVYPIVEKYGFVPVTAEEVISPGDVLTPKIEALIERSFALVADVSAPASSSEFRFALSKKDPNRVLGVVEKPESLPTDIANLYYITRPSKSYAKAEEFLSHMDDWFQRLARDIGPKLAEEPLRLLWQKEYRAAVISAITALEIAIRNQTSLSFCSPEKIRGLTSLISQLSELKDFSQHEINKINEWVQIRNKLVHSQQKIGAEKAKEIVEGVKEIIDRLKS